MSSSKDELASYTGQINNRRYSIALLLGITSILTSVPLNPVPLTFESKSSAADTGTYRDKSGPWISLIVTKIKGTKSDLVTIPAALSTLGISPGLSCWWCWWWSGAICLVTTLLKWSWSSVKFFEMVCMTASNGTALYPLLSSVITCLPGLVTI